jgi:hypothetical protein
MKSRKRVAAEHWGYDSSLKVPQARDSRVATAPAGFSYCGFAVHATAMRATSVRAASTAESDIDNPFRIPERFSTFVWDGAARRERLIQRCDNCQRLPNPAVGARLLWGKPSVTVEDVSVAELYDGFTPTPGCPPPLR